MTTQTYQTATFNFNLREPKKTTETPLYLVVAVGGRQYKFSTGVKVTPCYWDKRHERIRITDELSESARQNFMNSNMVLLRLKEKIFDFSSTNRTFTTEEIKNEIITSMANRRPIARTATATKVLEKAFEIAYKDAKGSTKNENNRRLSDFMVFMKKHGDSVRKLNQETINLYQEELISKGLSVETINGRMSLVTRLINKTIATKSEFAKYGVAMVNYKAEKDKRRQGDKVRRALTNEELDAVYSLKELNETESLYRDAFKMQVMTGVRFSDLAKLFNGEFNTEEKSDGTYYNVMTQKEEIPAIIYANDDIKALQAKYEGGVELNYDLYNKTIKALFKKAGQTQNVQFKKSKGEAVVVDEKPLHKVVSSHWARHTFVTMKLREGFSPEVIKDMTGHASNEMINKIYAHLTEHDKAERVAAARSSVSDKNKQTASSSDQNVYDMLNRQAVELEKMKQELSKLRSAYLIESQYATVQTETLNTLREAAKQGLNYEDMHELDYEEDELVIV